MTQVLVLTGFGINCERETAHAFQKAGGEHLFFILNVFNEMPYYLDKFKIFDIPAVSPLAMILLLAKFLQIVFAIV